ncbi:hypothetical protein IG626_09480 [Desulfovibrio desulfuricans]|uniref:hypothetical protein n=1 Tax=Desulfovibrio desulfuricans TaxID=876 RepID=UPI0017810D6C|nr:hypothetical protein [Desulfovibrio desulfuricans]MBD8896232.1 hypothetical protein [Desulfovibrio desulfuricans]
MSDDLTLPEKIERLGEDANLLHAWTHGDETESVSLGGVITPSPRKMMHDLDVRETAAAQAAIAVGVTAAGNSAAAAAQSAQIASAGADVVTAHAQSIELVAANIEAVQGASGNADAAAESAAAAAASAAAAAGAVPENLVARVAEVESKNSQQDTRLDAAEIDIAELGGGKVNLDLDNLTQAGSTKIAHFAMPSGRNVGMAVPAAGTPSAPAPGDGFIEMTSTSTAINGWLQITSSAGARDIYNAHASGESVLCKLQVRKGDTITFLGGYLTGSAIIFRYADGAY